MCHFFFGNFQLHRVEYRGEATKVQQQACWQRRILWCVPYEFHMAVCVCVLQTNLSRVKASNLKNMPVFEAQTTGMWKTFPNLLHRHVYTTPKENCSTTRFIMKRAVYTNALRKVSIWNVHWLELLLRNRTRHIPWFHPARAFGNSCSARWLTSASKKSRSSCAQHIDTKTALERI